MAWLDLIFQQGCMFLITKVCASIVPCFCQLAKKLHKKGTISGRFVLSLSIKLQCSGKLYLVTHMLDP